MNVENNLHLPPDYETYFENDNNYSKLAMSFRKIFVSNINSQYDFLFLESSKINDYHNL